MSRIIPRLPPVLVKTWLRPSLLRALSAGNDVLNAKPLGVQPGDPFEIIGRDLVAWDAPR